MIAVVLGSVSVRTLARTQPAVSDFCLAHGYAGRTAAQTQLSENSQDIAAKQAALVSEFDINGLKVLVKRREGSLTVSAGLFFRGGIRNITTNNAGIEALMLSASTEASSHFPRTIMRNELARTGTVIGSGVNYDYSALTLATPRRDFDRSWEIFADGSAQSLANQGKT